MDRDEELKKTLIEKIFKNEDIEYDGKVYENILEVNIGDVLLYKVPNKDEYKIAKITEGQFFANTRVSNWWKFKIQDDSGNFTVEISDYGNFYRLKE